VPVRVSAWVHASWTMYMYDFMFHATLQIVQQQLRVQRGHRLARKMTQLRSLCDGFAFATSPPPLTYLNSYGFLSFHGSASLTTLAPALLAPAAGAWFVMLFLHLQLVPVFYALLALAAGAWFVMLFLHLQLVPVFLCSSCTCSWCLVCYALLAPAAGAWVFMLLLHLQLVPDFYALSLCPLPNRFWCLPLFPCWP
jgi:hypothetical protein